MLVDVRSNAETLECRLSSKFFRGTVKALCDRGGQPRCEVDLTVREEVGFYSSSDAVNTHNLNIQRGL